MSKDFSYFHCRHRTSTTTFTYISRGNLSLDVVGLSRHAEGRRGVGAAGGGGGGQLALEGGAGSAADGERSGRGDACCSNGEGGLELHGWCLSGTVQVGSRSNENEDCSIDRKTCVAMARRIGRQNVKTSPLLRTRSYVRSSSLHARSALDPLIISFSATSRSARPKAEFVSTHQSSSLVSTHQSPLSHTYISILHNRYNSMSSAASFSGGGGGHQPPSTTVLYIDHSGHPAPLTLCYHATSSRVLSSSIDDRGNPSTITEVDSAYCPSCLSFYDATTASSADVRGYCPKATCRSCPSCQANLVVNMGKAKGESASKICYYLCGHCKWNSKECGITSPAPESESPTKEEARAATDALGTACKQAIASIAKKGANDTVGVSPPAKAFTTLVDGWVSRSKEAERQRREGEAASIVPGRRSDAARNRRKADGPGGWSVESLEEAMMKRREEEKASVVAPLVKGINLQRLSLGDAATDVNDSPAPTRPDAERGCGQAVLGPGMAASASMGKLYPLSVPLRPRKSRRCRAELAAGRTGILIKPKLNPLEGDSSLRSGHGQWWKKDSSAVHVVPRVRVVRQGQLTLADSRIRHALLLSVANPTLGMIRLRLNGADLRDFDASTASDDEGYTLQNILIDSLGRCRANVRMIGSTSTMVLPDMVELEAVEDALFDIGAGQNKEPKEVEDWDADTVLKARDNSSGSDDGPSDCPFSTVAVSKDRAWIQLVIEEDGFKETSTPGEFVAFPATLQVETGNGSWESSLIKSAKVKEGESDLVSFRLLLAWRA